MRTRLITMAAQALLIFALLAPLAVDGNPYATKAPDPLSMGPFPVGVTTAVLVDSSRTDNLTKEPRTLVTEIWYPAADDARGKPKNKFSDFLPGGVTPQLEALLKFGFRLSIAEINELYVNDAVRDAGVRKGRFPLVVFSHGNGGTRHQNTFWCDYLASHGYIVVSADHTGNARITIVNGKVILYQASERKKSAEDRPLDMIFLFDQMIKWDKGADKRFAGRIDTDRVCAAGMSFGSATSIRVADRDPRFKAIIAMAGAPETNSNLKAPTLRMLGTEDATIKEEGNARIRDQQAKHVGPSFMMELKNGGHYSFTDLFKISKDSGDGVGKGKRLSTGEEFEFTPMDLTYKIVNSYSVAFLGYYLKGEKEYIGFLEKNHWPDVMAWDAKVGNRQ